MSRVFWGQPIAFLFRSARQEMWCVFKYVARQACRVCTVAGESPRVIEVAHPFVVGHAGCYCMNFLGLQCSVTMGERLLCHLCHNRSGIRRLAFVVNEWVPGSYLCWERPSAVPGEG